MVKKNNNQKTSNRKNIIIVCLLFLSLALLWGFAVPHYTCESDKNRCDFKFWGKYYSKDKCEKKCKILPTTSPPVYKTSVEAPSVSKRYFCANVTHNDGNSYKMCAPCKPHTAYKHGAKYVVNGNTPQIQACDKYNSFDWKAYIYHYRDLKEAGIDTKEKSFHHWINHGEKEGRTFFKKGIQKYIDLKKIYLPLFLDKMSFLRKKISNGHLVSIIIPTYNRASIIKRAITSILKQDYTNFELII